MSRKSLLLSSFKNQLRMGLYAVYSPIGSSMIKLSTTFNTCETCETPYQFDTMAYISASLIYVLDVRRPAEDCANPRQS